jgi:hypothetical protein
VTPARAAYVLDRLLAERKITWGEVARHLADLPMEIARLEAQLDAQRSASATEERPSRTSHASSLDDLHEKLADLKIA